MNRIYLSVDYSEKNMAKAAGARWDDDARSWYFPTHEPLNADVMEVLPEALRSFAKQNPEIVRDPNEVRKEHNAQMRTALLTSMDQRFAELLAQMEAKPLDSYRPSWGDDGDAAIIRCALLQKFRETGKQAALEEISKTQDFNGPDVSKNFGYIMRRIVTPMWEDAIKARWEAVSKPFFRHYFDCLEQLDLNDLPHGYIQPGDKHVQGDLEIEFAHCNMMPVIWSIRYQGELLFHDRDKFMVTYHGETIAHAKNHNTLQELGWRLVEQHESVTRQRLADVVIDDDATRCVDGENYTIQTTDGRIITGFIADDEFFIYTLDGKPLGSVPEKDALCERIREVFKQTA